MYHNHQYHITTIHPPPLTPTRPTPHSPPPPCLAPPTNHLPLPRPLHSPPHRLAAPRPCDPIAGTPRSVVITPSILRSSTTVVRNTGAVQQSAPSRCRVSVWLTGTLVRLDQQWMYVVVDVWEGLFLLGGAGVGLVRIFYKIDSEFR